MYKYVGTYVFILGASTSAKQIAVAKAFQEENNPTKKEKRSEAKRRAHLQQRTEECYLWNKKEKCVLQLKICGWLLLLLFLL